MIGDTLNAAADSSTVQQIAVVFQAVLVIVGAIIAWIPKKGGKK